MKTKEELEELKEEYETLSTKLLELDEDELKEIIGGTDLGWDWLYERTIDDYQADTELGNRKLMGQ